ncbi:hypothetical protein SUGI_0806430 [Cryptomeria japonica]|nr:hypothetical protein SUGI_0806430 [Cryptomeria japonica]
MSPHIKRSQSGCTVQATEKEGTITAGFVCARFCLWRCSSFIYPPENFGFLTVVPLLIINIEMHLHNAGNRKINKRNQIHSKCDIGL